jgi:hypothetical protein
VIQGEKFERKSFAGLPPFEYTQRNAETLVVSWQHLTPARKLAEFVGRCARLLLALGGLACPSADLIVTQADVAL